MTSDEALRVHFQTCVTSAGGLNRSRGTSATVLLGVGVEVDAVGLQPLQVAHRPRHALPAEAVERPEEHQVELAPRRGREELGERFAVALALPAALPHVGGASLAMLQLGEGARPLALAASLDLAIELAAKG